MTRRFMVKKIRQTSRFAVFDDRGNQIGGASDHKATIEDLCDRLTRRAQAKNRPCITCQTSFDSEGPHHRMCDRCRQRGHSVDMRMMAG